MTKKQSNLAVSAPTKEDTLEQRIMKSNLSDDDKIELIKKLGQLVYYYPYYPSTWTVSNPVKPGYVYCKDNTIPTTITTTGNLTCESQIVTR